MVPPEIDLIVTLEGVGNKHNQNELFFLWLGCLMPTI
jgi:hypothetical protein